MRGCALAVAVCLVLHAAVAGPVLRARRAPGIVWLLLVDDLHIDFRNTGVVRAWLGSLVQELIRDDDVFALRTTGPSGVSVGLLAGMGDLQQGVRRISGRAIRFEDIRQHPESAHEVGVRAQVAMRAALDLVATAPEHDPRPRVMVYIGKGFDAADDIVQETDSFLREAWRRAVRVIAIDVGAVRAARPSRVDPSDPEFMSRLLRTRRNSLEQLALPTNGFVLTDEASVRQAAAAIATSIR